MDAAGDGDVVFGKLVTGKIEAVFGWGVIVDLNMMKLGLIDSLYIDDDDHYTEGDPVTCVLDGFDVVKNKFILRPPAQIPLMERLYGRSVSNNDDRYSG